MIYEYEYRIITDVNEKEYGIAVFNGDSLVDTIASVSSDKEQVFALVRRCNELQLFPVHLSDVVNDEF